MTRLFGTSSFFIGPKVTVLAWAYATAGALNPARRFFIRRQHMYWFSGLLSNMGQNPLNGMGECAEAIVVVSAGAPPLVVGQSPQ